MSRINVANFRHPDGTSDNINLTDTGRVGIGTASPVALLTVGSTSTSSTNSTIASTTTGDGGIYFYDGANSGGITYAHSTNDLYFRTNGSEKVRILSGGGITFNGDTAAANALDDYEEGTWTPTVTTGTVNVSNAVYTKIGRMVTCTANISTFSNRTSSNVIYVNNLPFTPAADVVVGVCTARYYAGPDVIAQVQTNGNMFFTRIANTGNFDQATHNDLSTDNSMFYFVATYSAA